MLSVGGFLADLRARAIEIMEALERTNIPCIVHGSIARGDVSSKSDIDVFIPEIYPSFTIVNALRKSGLMSGGTYLFRQHHLLTPKLLSTMNSPAKPSTHTSHRTSETSLTIAGICVHPSSLATSHLCSPSMIS